MRLHWALPAGAYLTWDSRTSPFILFRRFYYYYYFLLFSLFFLCSYPFPNSYSSSLSRCTPDLCLFPAYLLLFHFMITPHIFPSLSSTTFITFSFQLSSYTVSFPFLTRALFIGCISHLLLYSHFFLFPHSPLRPS